MNKRKWRNKRLNYTEARRLEILKGLIALSRRQLFDGVWSDLDTVAIKKHAYGELEYMTWRDAESLIEAHAKGLTNGNGNKKSGIGAKSHDSGSLKT